MMTKITDWRFGPNNGRLPGWAFPTRFLRLILVHPPCRSVLGLIVLAGIILAAGRGGFLNLDFGLIRQTECSFTHHHLARVESGDDLNFLRASYACLDVASLRHICGV